MPLFEFQQVSLRRSAAFSLGPVSLVVEPGGCLAVLGENGSGKSTLLALAAADLTPDQGTVLLQNQNLAELPATERAKIIAVVPQTLEFGLDFTVYETVLLGRYPHHPGLWETQVDREIADNAVHQLGLEHLKGKKLSEVSGGERQRTLLARALAQQPKILLLDEPTAHLDVRYHAELSRHLQALKAEGVAMVITSHDLNWALGFADQALLLREGKTIAQGPIAQTINAENLKKAFGVDFLTTETKTGRPWFIPAGS